MIGCEIGDFEAGSRESEYDLTAPESQAFLDDVNAALGTRYRFEEFPGR